VKPLDIYQPVKPLEITQEDTKSNLVKPLDTTQQCAVVEELLGPGAPEEDMVNKFHIKI